MYHEKTTKRFPIAVFLFTDLAEEEDVSQIFNVV
jgi:hypothetical protein